MKDSDILFYSITALCLWLIWLWITQPKYEDGEYVPFMARVRKVSKRILCRRYKQRADDP